MTPRMLTLASAILRTEKVGNVLGTAGNVAKTTSNIWGAARSGAETAAQALERHGHPILGTAARYAPHAAVAVGADQLWNSNPVLRMRYRYQQWQQDRAQRRAMMGVY